MRLVWQMFVSSRTGILKPDRSLGAPHVDELAGGRKSLASATLERQLRVAIVLEGVGGRERGLGRFGVGDDLQVAQRMVINLARPACRLLRTVHPWPRSEEHTSELQQLMRISYDVF